jgi:predicted O-methyltransferase YrrM
MIKQKIKQFFIGIFWRGWKGTFTFWERFGFHIIPNSYYQCIPDTRTLKDELWNSQSELKGININEKSQLELLADFQKNFKSEYDNFNSFPTSVPYEYYLNNDMYGSVDAEILYCMIRHFKPKNIFEIGSGYSTCLSAKAALKNQEEGSPCNLVAIEPFPNEVLKKGFPGLNNLIIKKIEDIDLAEFEKLEENDILFIDSSHALRIGGDVQCEYLKIIPRLKKGVIIHIHDIFLPAEYPKDWILKNFRFWTEQYLLHAFLAFNNSFEILWAGRYLHSKYPEKLETAFNSYDRKKIGPVSFWIRKIK